jgi:hypothetical protein
MREVGSYFPFNCSRKVGSSFLFITLLADQGQNTTSKFIGDGLGSLFRDSELPITFLHWRRASNDQIFVTSFLHIAPENMGSGLILLFLRTKDRPTDQFFNGNGLR